MTRKTLKGGAFGYLARGTSKFMGKTAKVTQNALIEKNASGKVSSLFNPKTFMGQQLKVHAFSLQEVAKIVFEFAKKYEKYSRICRKDKSSCVTKEQVQKDKEKLILQIKENLPLNDGNFYIKDPRKGYKTINVNEVFRKEDFMFLFRLNLLLKKWETEPNVDPMVKEILTILDTYYGFIKGISNDATKSEEQPYLDMTLYKVKIGKNIVKVMDKEVLLSFKFVELDHKEKTKEFNELYDAQYKMVVDNARDSANEASESATISEVQTYVDGIKAETAKDNTLQEYRFPGPKYNLTKKRINGNKFSYTIEPKA